MTTNNPRRGEVWLVDLEPTRGQEFKKQRPVVVLSADPIGSTGLRIVVPGALHPSNGSPQCGYDKADSRSRCSLY